MLQLRPNCEYCDKDLPPNATDARICSYECTFCVDCVESALYNVCPNCSGGFVPRPIRPSTERRPGRMPRFETTRLLDNSGVHLKHDRDAGIAAFDPHNARHSARAALTSSEKNLARVAHCLVHAPTGSSTERSSAAWISPSQASRGSSCTSSISFPSGSFR